MSDVSQYSLLLKKLVDNNLLTQQLIDEAVEEEKKTGKNIFKILVGRGYVDENVLLRSTADWLSMELIDLSKISIDRGAINKISASPPTLNHESFANAAFSI